MSEIVKLIDQLSKTKGVLGCGIVSKDGRPVEMRLPENMNRETIAIMCATVFGGSTTLHTEAGKATPTSINTKAIGYTTAIYQCGRRSLAIVMLEDDPDKDQINDIIKKLGTEFGPI